MKEDDEEDTEEELRDQSAKIQVRPGHINKFFMVLMVNEAP
jgi:hypothetical protein